MPQSQLFIQVAKRKKHNSKSNRYGYKIGFILAYLFKYSERYGLYNHLLPSYSKHWASYKREIRVAQRLPCITPSRISYNSTDIGYWLLRSLKKSSPMSTVWVLTLLGRTQVWHIGWLFFLPQCRQNHG